MWSKTRLLFVFQLDGAPPYFFLSNRQTVEPNLFRLINRVDSLKVETMRKPRNRIPALVTPETVLLSADTRRTLFLESVPII